MKVKFSKIFQKKKFIIIYKNLPTIKKKRLLFSKTGKRWSSTAVGLLCNSEIKYWKIQKYLKNRVIFQNHKTDFWNH